MDDTTSTGGMDWGSALDGAAQSMGKPLAANPTAFASYYGPIADQVAQKTGIDSNTILGQWGLETGWGKSVIPGTHNLGNMKLAKGQTGGVSATDNQTGSSDQYQKFASPGDFADAYTNLLTKNYAGALNTGTDAHATASALKQGGYAEDPDYVSKLTNAASTVAQARGQAPNLKGQGSNGLISSAGAADWGSLLDSAIPQAAKAGGQDMGGFGFTPMAQFESKYGIANQGANGGNPDPNPIVAGAAGLGRGLQNTMLGGQALVGKGAQLLGMDNVGSALVNDAQQGNAAGAKEYANAAGDSLSGKVGQVIGSSVPALFAGPEVLPQALAGAEFGAGNAALNNEAILPAAVEGAGLGAGGAALGKGLGAGYQAAKPLFTKAGTALKGGEEAAAAKIAQQVGPENLDSVISNLNANSNEIIPGSLPTAAEAANNSAITRIQRGLQNSEAGQEAFPARAAANNEARLQAGQDAVGPSANNANMMGPGLDEQVQAFTQSQAQRVAQGLTEVQPVTDAQAQIMQTPAYQKAITAARQDAQNAGIDSFQVQQQGLQRGLADQIEQVAGTPESLDAAVQARRAQAANDYAPVAGPISADTPAFADIEARPGFRTALRRAANIEDDMHGSTAADPFTYQQGERSLQMGNDGMMNWTEPKPQRFVDAGLLQGARSRLSEMAKAASQSDPTVAKGYRDTVEAIDNFLGNPDHVGGDIADAFSNARANYAANSVPIDQQRFLQSKLTPAVNNLTGEVNPTTLNSTINAVDRGQLKPGLNAADRITPEQLAALQQIGQQARQAPGNLTNLDSRGQEVLRQRLEAAATKGAPESVAARQQFNDYLAQQSPAYRELQNAAATQGANLQSRQQLAQALDKLSQAAHNFANDPKATLNAARQVANTPGLSGVQQQYAQSLLADLQRASAANDALGAAGSQTAANLNLGGKGLLGDLIGHKFGNGAIATAIGTGHVGTAIIGAVGQKLLGQAGVKTEKAAIDLLLNPKKLASALEKVKNQPGSKQAFIEALKSKAAQGGKSGIAAVQAYEAAQAH